MTIIPRRPATWLVLALSGLCQGCTDQDADRLASVGRKAAVRAGITSGQPPGWRAVRTSWDEATVDARVSARLRWEKALAELPLLVHAVGGVVELRGSVRDLGQRRRAVEIAESTTGVERVVDLLELGPAGP